MTLGEILQTLKDAVEGNNDNKVNRAITLLGDLFAGLEDEYIDNVILDDIWADQSTKL